MAYCPECGEKISESDTFCAYCGISLQPVASNSGDESGAQASPAPLAGDFSPVTENEEISDVAQPNEAEASADAGQKSAPEEFGSNPFAQFQPTEAPESDTAEQLNVKTDSEIASESSAEPEAESWEMTPAKAEVRSEGQAAELIQTSPVAEPRVTESADPGEKQESTEENLAPRQNMGVVSEIAPASDFAVIQEETQSPKNSDYNADFEQTMPYVPSGYLNEKKETLVKAEPTEASQPKSAQLDPGYMSFSMIPTPSRTEAISMPETPMETPPRDSVEPKLVSVNILPDFNSSAKRSAENNPLQEETPLPSESIHSPSLNENVSAPAANVPAKEKEARSYTSPNIGMTETDGKKSAKLKPLEEGTVLNGRYEIVRKIGGGGMGAVYLASDRNLGGVLRAVKEMVQSYIEDSQQEKAVNDFRRESLLLTSLEHPSIPTIFDYFYDDKECRFYLVMKYISGGDLAARLKAAPEGRIDEKTVTEWAIQIADVLDYLHNRQPPIVYRDLKPSNVMIDGNSGRVMLIDFGIARWVNKEEKGVTAVGTMGYAPPELFSGNVEARSDIYSLGSTMFHLLTGADPQSNPLLIFDFHKNPRPRQINSRLSDQIEQILVRAVEYNAEHRFKSASELREALTVHLENLKKGAATYGAGEAAKQAPATAVSQPVFCGFCGQKILVTDLFCPFCGAQQPNANAQSAPLKPAFSAGRQTARLMIIGTTELDSPQFQLDKENSLVGRRDPMSNIFPEVDLSKFDPQTKISRRHARIWREGASYLVEDLGSSNGTIVMSGGRENLRLLPHQPHVLANGDKIRVGDTMLHFFVG